MKKILLGLGMLLIIGLFGAGWFFSGVTYEAGLNPEFDDQEDVGCLLYTSPSPRDLP